MKGELGMGTNIKFWIDIWDKKVCAADRFNQEEMAFNGSWNWTRSPYTSEELCELSSLVNLLDGTGLSNMQDKWVWMGAKDKVMSVSIVKDLIISNRDFTDRYVFDWCKWVPKKCNVFMWRAVMDRIPTSTALQARNCFFDNPECVFCGEGIEKVEHIFYECIIAARVWQYISDWCKSPPFFIFSVKDLLKYHEIKGKSKLEKMVIKGIIMTSCWSIWKARNEIKFEMIKRDATGII
uniref:uncharacterized protein LOC122592223 n=1 Tax=Erigeron canadensis TaxID=72917 RepID=UPI001CB8C228|nr:uncharacterized protein LOC122592223 [Erigeron canadensis]